jgi:F-type H+-transporting ATPase subunit b
VEELITKLGIDWKLLIAQLVNFGILLYILNRFVFKPLLASLNARREQIVSSVKQNEEAEAKLKEAEALKEEVMAQARKEADSIIKGAEKNASKLKAEGLAETKKEAEKIIAQGKLQLENDRALLRTELKKEVGQLISLAVEKTVGDLVDTHAQKKLTDEAIEIIKSDRIKV